jgi:hypothetical protein
MALIWFGVVIDHFLAAQLKDLGRERATLRIGLASIQIDGDSHGILSEQLLSRLFVLAFLSTTDSSI